MALLFVYDFYMTTALLLYLQMIKSMLSKSSTDVIDASVNSIINPFFLRVAVSKTGYVLAKIGG